uniref:Uncharacterized protein n=1 Tax=Chenopodium quinoa TaxID=63459 RepID=A0A803N5C1_CHEQI
MKSIIDHSAPHSSVCSQSGSNQLELGLNVLDDISIKLKGLGKDINRDRCFRAKNSVTNSDHTWILATQGRNGKSRSFANIELKVNESLWENKDVSLFENLGKELVCTIICWVRGHKTNINGTLHHCENLSGTGVCVGARRPYGAKSSLASDMPRVLSPGSCAAATGVTAEPSLLLVLPGLSSPLVKKSSAVTAI